MKQTRTYLAWQRIADGRAQVRRWSPDEPGFLGYEKQDTHSLAWLQANGEPTWPECLGVKIPEQPYCVKHNQEAKTNKGEK